MLSTRVRRRIRILLTGIDRRLLSHRAFSRIGINMVREIRDSAQNGHDEQAENDALNCGLEKSVPHDRLLP